MKWHAAELHCHTLHSDGKFTVEGLMEAAAQEEYSCIALTDHNTLSGCPEITAERKERTLPMIPGIEWTTFFGHMTVLNCRKYVDWRYAVPDTIDRYVEEIKRSGGLVGIAHPFVLGSPMCTGCYWDFKVQAWENIDYLEVWSEDFPSLRASNYRSVLLWNRLLDEGYRIAPVYGRDWHGPEDESSPRACTYLGAPEPERGRFDEESALSALRSGHTAVTMGPLVLFRCEQDGKEAYPGDEITAGRETMISFEVDYEGRKKIWQRYDCRIEKFRLVGYGGKTIQEVSANGAFRFLPERGWIRAEAWGTMLGKECCIAMTNAVRIR